MTNKSRTSLLYRLSRLKATWAILPFALASFSSVGAQLLVTEIQSDQAASGVNDYWELTNIGATNVNLSNWKWDDNSHNPNDPAAVAIPTNTVIAPGESIIFTAMTPAAFRTWWGIDNSVQVISTGAAPGLGMNDDVALFNPEGVEECALSYAAAGFTRSNGSPAAGGHAGISAGGASATLALVLDPTFGTNSPGIRYTAAAVGSFGAFASAASPNDIGSPGVSGLGAPPAITLTVSVTPSSFSESSTNPAAVGTVTRSTGTSSNLVVNLASSDGTEATVPATVTILAGETNATFNVTAVNDTFPDGNKVAIITASAPGATPGRFNVTVQDDGDVATLKLMLTEVLSDESGGAPAGAQDYWELSNFGPAPVDLTGFTWHDSGRSYAVASNYALPPGSSILPGEAVIFTTATPAAFRTWWGISNTVKVFQTVGAPGLGMNDGISFFDNGGNELFFFSYAASGFTRENGTTSTGGHAGPSAGASAATVAVIWVPSSGTTTPRYTFATGSNYGSFSAVAPATDLGSPGTTTAGPKSLDLSKYVRVGRFDLPSPSGTTPPNSTNLLCHEASGVAYNWDTDTLFIVGDGGRSFTQVSKTGVLIDTMTLALGGSPQGTDFYDPEGVAYIGNGQFVFTEERDRQLVKITYVAGFLATRANAQTVKLGTFVQNIGLEGLSYDPLTDGFICVKEITPIGIFQTTVDFDAGTASNGSPTTENSTNLFDPALLGMSDVADVFALANVPSFAGQPAYSHLLVISQQDAKIVLVDRSGTNYGTLTIVSDPGHPLPISEQQHEGITMDRDGIIYVVNENEAGVELPQLWVYAPSAGTNQAPTAVDLNNTLNAIAENTSTVTPVKVADIVVADDGLGTNVLSLSGPDAAFFEITGAALFIKAGTALDYETKTTYNVTVNVDDLSVGATPDATNAFMLTVTDIVDETAAVANLIISEVAPWSSGNSPLAADWFEVSNLGTNHVNITGWKVDDSSASYAVGVFLNGVTNIAPGESVIFIETSNLSAARSNFLSTWFGLNAPTNLQIGNYTGGGIGLSTGGDAVILYDTNETIQARVAFGTAAAGPFTTFDNAIGINGTNNITRLSAPRVYGAFHAANDPDEIGSPGSIGRLIISEVAAWSSGSSPVAADWFEVINTTPHNINLTGWRVDDSSAAFGNTLLLNGITNIAPGEAVIFLESANLATIRQTFLTNWFGLNAPTNLQIGSYTGSGIGLSTGGDAVVLFDSIGTVRASVFFGGSPLAAPFATFDNSFGLNGTTISQLSAVGVHSAFAALNSTNEIGSPGTGGKIVISEIAPWANDNSPVGVDWFELSNTGSTPLDLRGWKMDDVSESPVLAVVLTGITNVAPGESVIFLNTATLAETRGIFLTNWFGTNLPASLQFGGYTGSGVGLGAGGDAVNIYSSNNVLQASVFYGSSPTNPFPTFDNGAGLNQAGISQLSAVGTNGAFVARNSPAEIGSPGIMTVPDLTIVIGTNQATIRWTAESTGYRFQNSFTPDSPTTWTNALSGVLLTNGQNQVTIPFTNDLGFFRLRRP